MSVLPSRADVVSLPQHVRLVPSSGPKHCTTRRLALHFPGDELQVTTAITDGSRKIILRRGNQSNFADVASLVVAVRRSLDGARSVNVEGSSA